MHNGGVARFERVKRAIINHVSDTALRMIQVCVRPACGSARAAHPLSVYGGLQLHAPRTGNDRF